MILTDPRAGFLAQRLLLNWLTTQLVWYFSQIAEFTMSIELKSLDAYLLYSHAMLHESMLKVYFRTLTHISVDYLTKLPIARK